MTKDESTILHEHGERLARIETVVSNHVLTELSDIKSWLGRLDARLWWIVGTMVVILAGVVATLVGVSK